jgi:hypothetical protein
MTEEIDRCIEAYEQAKLGKTVVGLYKAMT